MNQWLEQIDETIRGRSLFCDGEPILIGVSGGIDSMVLLHTLHALAPRHGWELLAGHYNHQLRGEDSDADEALVRQTVRTLELPVAVGRGDVKKLSGDTGMSIEMAARKLRHDFFAQTAVNRGISTVALAHHAGDQVELFFLRVLRGTGGLGLSGMRWASPSPSNPDVRLVRPLLGHSKSDLQAYAREHEVSFAEDATNASLDIQRNRIRHELIPSLEASYQPALARTTLRLMEVIGAEAELVTQLAQQWLENKGETSFEQLPVAVQRRCLQLQLFKLNQAVEFDFVERLRVCPAKAIAVSPLHSVMRDREGRVHVRKNETVQFGRREQFLQLSREGEEDFERLRIQWAISDSPGTEFEPQPNVEYFDAEKVGKDICLRFWRPGDRFQPIGTRSATKLQDLFVNLRVSQEERHQRVVAISSRGEIFWVEGLRISERFKLDKQTTRRLKWMWATR